jgi:micrococcal nuclease
MADYSYNAKLVRVVDGDTVYLDVDLGFNIRTVMDFRLFGINTPETIGATKTAGLAAKVELERLLSLGPIVIQTTKADKYGRWLAKIWVQTADEKTYVNDSLVNHGFATVYFGTGAKT